MAPMECKGPEGGGMTGKSGIGALEPDGPSNDAVFATIAPVEGRDPKDRTPWESQGEETLGRRNGQNPERRQTKWLVRQLKTAW